MAFERIEIGGETGKRNGGKNGGGIDRREQLALLIKRWLADDLVLVEVARHQGRGGYVPALAYELIDDGLEDVEGVTVRGVNPYAFTDGLINDVREHASERGNANYLVMGKKQVIDGDSVELKEAFRYAIPKAWIGEIPDGDDAGAESPSAALLAGFKNLVEMQARYIGELHKVGIEKDKAGASVIEANAKSLLANAENIGQHAPAVELELAKLEMERERLRAEVDVLKDKARQDRNARLFDRLIETVGPDVVAAIRILAQRWGGGDASAAEQPSSEHAAELASILASCSDEQRAKLRKTFGADAWSVIESAAKADTDAAFAACWGKLMEMMGALDESERLKILAAVSTEIGSDLSRRLMDLFKNVR